MIKSIAPDVQIIDVTHGISPQHVLQGALVLANTTPYMPVGVHLAVVDPGVGSSRRPLALRSGDGRLFVGPDNGLLVPAAERLGGIAAVHELANADYALDIVSRTFHGRDLFAPAAAHLAAGVELEAASKTTCADAGPAKASMATRIANRLRRFNISFLSLPRLAPRAASGRPTEQ